jgi:hypothetical protein
MERFVLTDALCARMVSLCFGTLSTDRSFAAKSIRLLPESTLDYESQQTLSRDKRDEENHSHSSGS